MKTQPRCSTRCLESRRSERCWHALKMTVGEPSGPTDHFYDALALAQEAVIGMNTVIDPSSRSTAQETENRLGTQEAKYQFVGMSLDDINVLDSLMQQGPRCMPFRRCHTQKEQSDSLCKECSLRHRQQLTGASQILCRSATSYFFCPSYLPVFRHLARDRNQVRSIRRHEIPHYIRKLIEANRSGEVHSFVLKNAWFVAVRCGDLKTMRQLLLHDRTLLHCEQYVMLSHNVILRIDSPAQAAMLSPKLNGKSVAKVLKLMQEFGLNLSSVSSVIMRTGTLMKRSSYARVSPATLCKASLLTLASAMTSRFDVVSYLTNIGMDMNEEMDNRNTVCYQRRRPCPRFLRMPQRPLLLASLFIRQDEALNSLLTMGADPLVCNGNGLTPLIGAASHGSFDRVSRVLHSAYAHICRLSSNEIERRRLMHSYVNQESLLYGTALHQAVNVCASEDVVRLLLEFGADPVRKCRMAHACDNDLTDQEPDEFAGASALEVVINAFFVMSLCADTRSLYAADIEHTKRLLRIAMLLTKYAARIDRENVPSGVLGRGARTVLRVLAANLGVGDATPHKRSESGQVRYKRRMRRLQHPCEQLQAYNVERRVNPSFCPRHHSFHCERFRARSNVLDERRVRNANALCVAANEYKYIINLK
ncbi:MAG: hypothetical protein MHM6MM_005711 [Cercozoa sp. M6MM]